MNEAIMQAMVWCLVVSFFAGMGAAVCLRFCASMRRREEDIDWAAKQLIPPRASLSERGRIVHSFLVVGWSVAAVLILTISVSANLE